MASFEIALRKPVTPTTGRANRVKCRTLVTEAVEPAVLTAVQMQQCRTKPCGTRLMITTLTSTGLDEFCAHLQSLGQCRRLSHGNHKNHNKKTEQDAELRGRNDRNASEMRTTIEETNVVTALADIRGTADTARSRKKCAHLGMRVLASGQKLANSSRKRKLGEATSGDNVDDGA